MTRTIKRQSAFLQLSSFPAPIVDQDSGRRSLGGSDSAIEATAASGRRSSPLDLPVLAPAWRQRGNSLIELMVALSILATLVHIAVPMWRAGSMNIVTARKVVIANLREARTNAITKSVHYQVSFAADKGAVTLSKMLQPTPPATTWAVDTTKVQTSALPKSTQVSTPSVVVEFNTRGMVVNSSAVTVISFTDSFGHTKSLQVWPSGQVHEL